MSRVKVAHVATADIALRILLLNQLRGLQRAGYEVVGISSPGPEVAAIEEAGIRHVAVAMTRRPFAPAQDLAALWRLYEVFRHERPAIVHTHNPKPGLLGQLAARLAGVPVVVNTLHGYYFQGSTRPALRRFYITLERIAARCSDAILSQNREDMGTAVHEGICRAPKMKYLGNGIDLDRFDPGRLSRCQLAARRAEIGLAEGSPVVGFVGRLVREKGLLELFAASRLVRERFPGVCFLLVGPVDAPKRDAVTPATAQVFGVADVCRFLGLRSDMPELYALMDVLVLPSHREGFPRAPMEASAMGVPCVVTRIRGCTEAVEHGRNGLLVPPGDAPALAAAITGLLADPARARRLGEEAQRMARERFDERIVLEKVKTEYARLLSARGIPVPGPEGGRLNGWWQSRPAACASC
jgi:glycosyltransferase involved in cell wall biosynthesis